MQSVHQQVHIFKRKQYVWYLCYNAYVMSQQEDLISRQFSA